MRFRFTIRDLLWLTLVVALASGWWADRLAIRRWRAEHLAEAREARDLALQNWRIVRAKYETGTVGGETEKEAQAREQYFFYREQLEQAAGAWLYFHPQ